MPRVRSAPRSCTLASEVLPVAVIIRDAAHIDRGFEQTGFTELLGMLGRVQLPEPSVAIAADGPIPVDFLAWLRRKTEARSTLIPLNARRILPENFALPKVDPSDRTLVRDGMSVCTAWTTSTVRIVFSRVKTDNRNRYSLGEASFASLQSGGTATLLSKYYPPHCTIVADPVYPVPMVVANNGLLADWVGAVLMGRDPHSSPDAGSRFLNGHLPRTYRIVGDQASIASWKHPPSLSRGLPHATIAAPVPPFTATTAYAETWMSVVREAFEPFMGRKHGAVSDDRPLSLKKEMLSRVASVLSPESLGELLTTLLKGLGLLLTTHPQLRADAGSLDAVYRIATRDQRLSVYARFNKGTLTVERAVPDRVHVTLFFSDVAAMVQLFATDNPDLLGAMLRQQVAFDGNLNYLLKLAYLLKRIMRAVKGELRSDG